MWLVALGLLGCDRTPPELVAAREAVAQWREGEARLQAGDPDAAAAIFAEARRTLDHPVLTLWHARAVAEGGNLIGAVALLDQVLKLPDPPPEARYNRAAYLARLDRPEEAGPELEAALSEGGLSALVALEDPDFAALRAHPAFAFLPDSALVVEVEPPPPVAFLGSEITLRLRLSGLVRPPITIVPGVAEGPLQLVSAVEDRISTPSGPGTELTWTWRIAGAGTVTLGPLEVTAGDHRASTAPIEVEASAPPDRVLPSLPPPSLPIPSAALGGLEGPGARLRGSILEVRAGPRDRVTLEPPGPPPAERLEGREAGRTRWVLLRYPGAQATQRVVITAVDGTQRWAGAPTVDLVQPRR